MGISQTDGLSPMAGSLPEVVASALCLLPALRLRDQILPRHHICEIL